MITPERLAVACERDPELRAAVARYVDQVAAFMAEAPDDVLTALAACMDLPRHKRLPFSPAEGRWSGPWYGPLTGPPPATDTKET